MENNNNNNNNVVGGSYNELLNQIMMVQFAMVETNLYLNTHPYDQRALAHHNMLSKQFQMLRQQYEMLYGPLTFQGQAANYWSYLCTPWPWDIEY